MKVVLAVLLACVAVARAGLVAAPYAAAVPAISNVQTLPTAYAAAPLAYAAPAAIAAPYAAYAAPAVAYAAPAVSYAAPIAAPAIGASYVAQTRGSVHTAPLPGHAIGSIQTNVAPAPGTL